MKISVKQSNSLLRMIHTPPPIGPCAILFPSTLDDSLAEPNPCVAPSQAIYQQLEGNKCETTR